MTIDTRHPQREGASRDPDAVRNALDSLREKVASVLNGYGVPSNTVDAFDHKWQYEIDQLLQKAERNR